MKTFFLEADQPIVKQYELNAQGQLVKHSYPFVYEVTSFEEHPTSLQDLERLINKHAAYGRCMLKGELARPLVTESRAGSTDSDQKTSWICLDLDGVDKYQNVDLFLQDIGLGDIDYIIQWSSSMGIENSAGFRCHIFMLLDRPHHPQLLKYWLTELNLKTPTIASQLQLTKTGNSLRWPLDITTCQNDKLLYIAPPTLGAGILDPYATTPRVSYVQRAKRTAGLPTAILDRDSLRELIDKKIAELRASSGLPKRSATKYKYSGSVEYMAKPGAATITEMKTERGFVYFNLNGGDSWAYYHPEDNPKYIYNFKGEPNYRTEDLLPEYWGRLQQRTMSHTPNAKGLIHLAFRDFRTSNYYNGTYDTATDTLNLAMAKNESQLRQFMAQHGQHLGEFIPDWDLIWEPQNPMVVDVAQRKLNTYQPSPFFASKSQAPAQVPPTIQKVISHVLGHDQVTIDHFLNWLAVIIQTQGKTGTAWVWQGTQGTGKGVLFHQIITPLLSDQNVVSKRMEELESEFTGFMENKFVVFIDEIESGKSLYHTKVTAKLKNLIVEPWISIRRMYTPAYMARNYASMIFASNKPAAVEVAPDDRRFNVGPYQTLPISLTSTEIDSLIPAELEGFFQYLRAYPADPNRARSPLQSAARSTLINISRPAIDSLSDALINGNLEFLWDQLSAYKIGAGPQNTLTQLKYQPYRDLVVDLVTNLPASLSREELLIITEWCIGNMPTSPHKFTSVLKHHGLPLKQVWQNGRNVRGISVSWNPDPQWLAQARADIAAGLV